MGATRCKKQQPGAEIVLCVEREKMAGYTLPIKKFKLGYFL